MVQDTSSERSITIGAHLTKSLQQTFQTSCFFDSLARIHHQTNQSVIFYLPKQNLNRLVNASIQNGGKSYKQFDVTVVVAVVDVVGGGHPGVVHACRQIHRCFVGTRFHFRLLSSVLALLMRCCRWQRDKPRWRLCAFFNDGEDDFASGRRRIATLGVAVAVKSPTATAQSGRRVVIGRQASPPVAARQRLLPAHSAGRAHRRRWRGVTGRFANSGPRP